MAAWSELAKPRTGEASATRAFSSANGTRALRSATSCSLRARMVLRMSLMVLLPGRRALRARVIGSERSNGGDQHAAGGDVLLHAGTGAAVGDDRAGARQAVGDAFRNA